MSWCADLPDPRKIKEVDCEFRTRLAPRMKGDYWWKYGGLLSPPAKSARHLIATYLEFGEPHFRRYDSLEKIASMISIDAVRHGAYIEAFGGITSVRAALVMARIHAGLGHAAESRRFASAGLANIGGATILRGELERLSGA
jgi:hypothetical protein